MRPVVDDLGEMVTVSDGAPRLVSLVPNVSEVLASWGLADRLVGVTDWCVAPAGAFEHAERVRGTKNPDVARIAALRPTLVVANEEENRELDVRRLREAGVAVYVTRVRTVAEAADSLERLGWVLGVGEPATTLAGRLRSLSTPPALATAPVLTLCPIWRDPWLVVGVNTVAGDLLRLAGARLWPPDPQARYPKVDLAAAREAGVELVLLPDEPYPFGPNDREVFADWLTPVHLIDGAALTWWGPRAPDAHAELVARVGSARQGHEGQ